ncbi:hypothetical protein [Caballeronia sp. LZ001]|uniref:hypothetical protein n=1 Tax=Caballeronia sp. LZ001 TaxID=3038553 RepID=UPI00285A6904|nr:hypothetical protein [Caballeronia sp. LZ001]MDR5806642.1 hypothetical protein [Caballeronia sp. LZ001]
MKIELELTKKVYDGLVMVASTASERNVGRHGSTTHGAIDVSRMLEMLAEDVSMMHTRPASLGASNMFSVFASHGYRFE